MRKVWFVCVWSGESWDENVDINQYDMDLQKRDSCIPFTDIYTPQRRNASALPAQISFFESVTNDPQFEHCIARSRCALYIRAFLVSTQE